jgi:hypothetical protein
MFATLFAEVSDPDPIEPHVKTIGNENVQLFYKWIWVRLRNPDIENFGKRFFFELCDLRFQIYLLKTYMTVLTSLYSQLCDLHSHMLGYYISDEIDDEQQERLAIFESNLITESEQLD